MKSAAIAIALLMTLAEPGSAAGFDAVDAGAIHDTGPLASTPAGIAMLSSGATVMVGVTLTGDTVSSFAPLIARVEPDGTVAWTRSGASLAWQASRVVEGPDDTVIVYGSNASPAPGDYLARFDADGAELWNERILLESMLVDLVVDGTGITAIENPEPEDARLTRFSPDGSLLWQANVSALAGCIPNNVQRGKRAFEHVILEASMSQTLVWIDPGNHKYRMSLIDSPLDKRVLRP